MKRRLLIGLMIAWALIGAAALGLWVRGYMVRDAAGVWFTDRRVAGIVSTNGSMSFLWVLEQRPSHGVIWTTRSPEPIADHFGFGFERDRGGGAISLPDWCVILIALLLCAWLRRRARAAGHVPGTCKQCGYDLRASPERCPECGALSADQSSAASVPRSSR